jgi:hypothetical protein
MKRDPRSVSDLPSDSYRGSEWKRRSARTSVQFLKSALMRADQPLVRNRAMRMYDAIDRELLVKVSSGHHTQPVYIGTAQLCARRDLVPRPVVSIDPVGERRQLRQVIQFNNTFRHRGALSRSGSHRTAGCSHGLRLCCREYSKGRRRRQRQNRSPARRGDAAISSSCGAAPAHSHRQCTSFCSLSTSTSESFDPLGR